MGLERVKQLATHVEVEEVEGPHHAALNLLMTGQPCKQLAARLDNFFMKFS